MRSRVLLADDHLEMMTAVRHLIEPVCTVVGTIGDGVEVIPAVARLRPDVVVVDLNVPGVNGIELCRRIACDFPETGIIVLTAEMDTAIMQLAIAAGAHAFVNKLAAADELLAAIARVHGRNLQD